MWWVGNTHLVLFQEEIHDFGVNPETRRGVGGLPQQTGADPGVQGAETLVFDNSARHGDGASGRAELQADLMYFFCGW